MAISVPQLSAYMAQGLNIMVTGEAGTGKTAMLTDAAAKLGWTMKYFSASTLDPFADLIGIPVPNTDDKTMEYYRSRDIEEADILFFDEASRADDKVINAIFEVTQFRTLNGCPLPNLKSVVVALNPVDGYQGVEELDLAFVDRFDIYLESEVKADYNYLKAKFGSTYARVGIKLFDEYQRSYKNALRSKKNTLGYFSPRRLEKLMAIYKMFPKAETFRAVLPSDVVISARTWVDDFDIALGRKTAPSPDEIAKKKAKHVKAKSDRDAAKMPATVDALIQNRYPDHSFRAANRKKMQDGFAWAIKHDPTRAEKITKHAVKGLSYGFGPDAIMQQYKDIVKNMTPKQRGEMISKWPYSKQDKFHDLCSKHRI